MTQEDLAARMSERGFPFHQATIYKIEGGTRKVSIAEATALASIVGLPLQLLTIEEPSRLGVDRLQMVSEARQLVEAMLRVTSTIVILPDLQSQFEALVATWAAEADSPDFGGRSAPDYFSSLLEHEDLDEAWFGFRRRLLDDGFTQICADLGIDLTAYRRLYGLDG
jgi:transcriptional regulator with XRE-family HTH domain